MLTYQKTENSPHLQLYIQSLILMVTICPVLMGTYLVWITVMINLLAKKVLTAFYVIKTVLYFNTYNC